MRRKPKKGTVKMVGKEELELLKANQVRKAETQELIKELTDRILSPFDDLINELEAKRDEVQELKDEIEELAG